MTQNRKNDQIKAFRVFSGDYKHYINRELALRHNSENATDLSGYNKPQRNVLKRVSNLLSVLYSQSPRRRSKNKNLDHFLKWQIQGLDTTLESISKYVNAVGDFFIAPFPSKEDKKIYLDLVEPWLVDVETDRGKTVSITVPLKNKQSVKWFPNGRYIKYNKNNKEIEKADSGLNCLPVIWFKLEPVSLSDDPWSVQSIMDLVDSTVELGILECYHKNNAFLRSFRVLSAAGEINKGDLAKTSISNKKLLPFKIEGTSLADPNDPYGDTVTKVEHHLAGTRGISSLMYSGDLTSSDQVSTVSEELLQHWKSSIKIFSTPERELLRVCLAMSNKNFGTNFDINIPIFIDYIQPSVDLDNRKKSLDNLEQDIKLGTDSSIDYLLRNYPDILDREQAKNIVLQNIKDKAFIHNLMREQNQAAELPELGESAGLTPEENGSLGGQMKNKTDAEKAEIKRENSGGNSAPLVSKPYQE